MDHCRLDCLNKRWDLEHLGADIGLALRHRAVAVVVGSHTDFAAAVVHSHIAVAEDLVADRLVGDMERYYCKERLVEGKRARCCSSLGLPWLVMGEVETERGVGVIEGKFETRRIARSIKEERKQ